VSGPQRRRFIFPGDGLGAHLWVPVPPDVEVARRRATALVRISQCLLLPVSAPPGPATLFARVAIYELYGKISGRAYSGKLSTEIIIGTIFQDKFSKINQQKIIEFGPRKDVV
jgi:hypothetical protein